MKKELNKEELKTTNGGAGFIDVGFIKAQYKGANVSKIIQTTVVLGKEGYRAGAGLMAKGAVAKSIVVDKNEKR